MHQPVIALKRKINQPQLLIMAKAHLYMSQPVPSDSRTKTWNCLFIGLDLHELGSNMRTSCHKSNVFLGTDGTYAKFQ